MKKYLSILILAVCALALSASALDMASYGTTATITNNASTATMGKVLITYDAATTNTIYFDVIRADGITYRLGSDAVSNAVYSDASDLLVVPIKAGEKWKITTTATNVNLNISGI